MRIDRRSFARAALALMAMTGVAAAQDFPSRPLIFVNGFAPGAPTDILARLLAPALENAFGQKVVVENRAGAGGTIAMNAVAKAEPDGYTFLLVDSALAVGKILYPALAFDPEKDLEPIGLAARASLVLAVKPPLPAKDLKEFIALAKASPGGLNYGSPGIGTPPHLGTLAFMRAAGVKMTEVQYRGAAPAMADVIAGHLDLLFIGPSAVAPQIVAGKVRGLAITGEKRAAALPDVPTFSESGLADPELNVGSWWGLVAPAKTPPDVVGKLNAALRKALADPVFVEPATKQGYSPQPGSPEDFRRFAQSQTKFWSGMLSAPKPAK